MKRARQRARLSTWSVPVADTGSAEKVTLAASGAAGGSSSASGPCSAALMDGLCRLSRRGSAVFTDTLVTRWACNPNGGYLLVGSRHFASRLLAASITNSDRVGASESASTNSPAGHARLTARCAVLNSASTATKASNRSLNSAHVASRRGTDFVTASPACLRESSPLAHDSSCERPAVPVIARARAPTAAVRTCSPRLQGRSQVAV
jgi:hypothetical protein